MSVKVPTNRLIVSSLNQSAGFYQQLLSKVSSFKELGNRLITEAETAQAFLQIGRVEDVALVLSNTPIKEYQLIRQYYLGWSAYRKGEDARSIFNKVLEESKTYKARALISLAALEARKGDYGSELRCYIEAIKLEQNPTTTITALRGVPLVKSKEGFRPPALKDLEDLVPLLRNARPNIYYDCLNSYAVELGEAGRIEEATNVCKIVLASPFAFAYPEWRETAQEIKLRGYKSRSSVSVVQPVLENVVQLPVPDSSSPVQNTQARILNYLEWKKKMGKEPNGEKFDCSTEELESMDEKDLMVKLLFLTTQEGANEKRLRKIVAYALKVFSEPED